MIGKLIGKVVAAPIKAVIAIPDTLADIVNEVGEAIDPEPTPRKKPGRIVRPR